MEHLEYHPHAYLDSDNFVVSVLLFDSHDYDLINSFKDNFGVVDIKSCCEYGECGVGAYFYNGKLHGMELFKNPHLSMSLLEEQLKIHQPDHTIIVTTVSDYSKLSTPTAEHPGKCTAA